MFLLGPEADLVFSASDLVRAAECPYASLCVLDEKLGRAPRRAPERDAMLARTAELGDAHEHRVLAAHLAAFGPWDAATGRGVHEVEPARRWRSRRSDARRSGASTGPMPSTGRVIP